MKELVSIQARLKAPKGQFNKFGKFKYRSCEDILEAVKPLLSEYGVQLTISDEMVEVGGRIYVKATALLRKNEELVAVSGFAREGETQKGMDSSQITGAASSYARKYALNGLFCIDDTKDSDATNNGENTVNEDKKCTETGKTDAENLSLALQQIKEAKTAGELVSIWNSCQGFKNNKVFIERITARKKEVANAV